MEGETSGGWRSYCKKLSPGRPRGRGNHADFQDSLMTNTAIETGANPAPKSLIARFIGVITAPTDTFRSVVAVPRWFGMLALVTLGIALFTTAPMLTEAGREAALNQQVTQSERWSGQPVSDQQYEAMRRMSGITPYITAAGVLVMVPLMTLITGGILYAIFNAAMGGNATFKQVIAVVAHASVISMLSAAFTAPVNLARGTMGSATTFGVLLPMVDENSFLGRLLGMLDLFMIWYVIVLAIGLAVLYRRRTQPIAITLFGIYAGIVVVIAMVMSRMGGGN